MSLLAKMTMRKPTITLAIRHLAGDESEEPEILHPAGGESVGAMINLKISRPLGVKSVVAGIQYPPATKFPSGISLQLNRTHSCSLMRLESSP